LPLAPIFRHQLISAFRHVTVQSLREIDREEPLPAFALRNATNSSSS
jgi:hypothetical protein